MQRIERTFAGRHLVIETGRMAKQAAGSAVVQFGDTMVLAAVTVSDNESPLPFFPSRRVPGEDLRRGQDPRRVHQARRPAQDKEILAARIIDRSIRPLFPEGFKNEVQVFITSLAEGERRRRAGARRRLVALNASKIPFTGPIAGVRVGRVQENWILNPTFQQLDVQRHGHRRRRLEGLDHDGRGRRARGHRRRCSRRSRSASRASRS